MWRPPSAPQSQLAETVARHSIRQANKALVDQAPQRPRSLVMTQKKETGLRHPALSPGLWRKDWHLWKCCKAHCRPRSNHGNCSLPRGIIALHKSFEPISSRAQNTLTYLCGHNRKALLLFGKSKSLFYMNYNSQVPSLSSEVFPPNCFGQHLPSDEVRSFLSMGQADCGSKQTFWDTP